MPKGSGAVELINSLPANLVEEWLLTMRRYNEQQGRHNCNVVIDLCAGWQSIKPVAARLGFHYIAVDIKGDRGKSVKPTPSLERGEEGGDVCELIVS